MYLSVLIYTYVYLYIYVYIHQEEVLKKTLETFKTRADEAHINMKAKEKHMEEVFTFANKFFGAKWTVLFMIYIQS